MGQPGSSAMHTNTGRLDYSNPGTLGIYRTSPSETDGIQRLSKTDSGCQMTGWIYLENNLYLYGIYQEFSE